MTWNPAAQVTGAMRALSCAQSGGTWALRALYSLSACRPEEPVPLWTAELSPDVAVIGSHPVLVAEDLVITLEDHGSAADARLLAFDARSGKSRWTRDLALRASTVPLALAGGHLIVHGRDGDGGCVYRVDVTTGQAGERIAAPAGPGVQMAAGRLWIAAPDGLWSLDTDADHAERVSELPSLAMTSAGDVLYVLEDAPTGSPRPPAVVMIDARSGEETGRSDAAVSARETARIFPMDTPGRVLLLAGEGPEIVSVDEGRVVRLAIPEGTRAASAAPTPQGVAVLCGKLGAAQRPLVFDAASGAMTQELEAGDVFQGSVWYGNDQIVVSGEAVTFFRWSDE